MKLYVYDHCPYCVRAMMVANYKQITHETRYLLNDDEKSCYDLIGAKMLPILEFDNQSAMGESLDIVDKLNEVGATERVLLPKTDVNSFLEPLDKANFAINGLLFPRNVALGLPEFATQEAIDYFTAKKSAVLGFSFEQAMSNTASYIKEVESVLDSLPELSAGDALSYDDVLIFPTLRNLTMVEGLRMPAHIVRYLERISVMTAVPLYYDKAI